MPTSKYPSGRRGAGGGEDGYLAGGEQCATGCASRKKMDTLSYLRNTFAVMGEGPNADPEGRGSLCCVAVNSRT